MFLMEVERFDMLDIFERAALKFTDSFVELTGGSDSNKAYIYGKKNCIDYCAGQMRSELRRRGLVAEVCMLSNGDVPDDGIVYDLDEYVIKCGGINGN